MAGSWIDLNHISTSLSSEALEMHVRSTATARPDIEVLDHPGGIFYCSLICLRLARRRASTHDHPQ